MSPARESGTPEAPPFATGGFRGKVTSFDAPARAFIHDQP
jgi:hypothetical protein